MRLLSQTVVVVLICVWSVSAADAGWVSGYFRADGTYVPGYFRSESNSTVTDNYSFYGNRNPFTGDYGTNRYYSAPSSPYYSPFHSYSAPSYRLPDYGSWGRLYSVPDYSSSGRLYSAPRIYDW